MLNSKFFGVPQNRERIYFVGRYSPGGGRPKVFPIRQNAREVSKNGEVKFSNSDPRGFGWRDLSPTLAARDYKDPKWVKLNKPDQVGKVCDGDGGRVFSTNGTSCTLKAQGGGWGAKTGLYEVINPYNGKRSFEETGTIGTSCGTSTGKTAQLIIKRKSLNKNQIDKLNKMEVDEKTSRTLTQAIGRGGSSKEYLAMLKRNQKITGQIRRLTPIECERLQGFPDNWTDGQSDTQRYKQCGNAITVNVAEAIFRKLYEVRR